MKSFVKQSEIWEPAADSSGGKYDPGKNKKKSPADLRWSPKDRESKSTMEMKKVKAEG